jgi:hypothetical protein
MRPQMAYAALHEALPAEFGLCDEHAVSRLCWRESLPALAMAAPLVRLVQDKAPNVSMGKRLAELFYCDDWVAAAIEEAQAIAALMEICFQPRHLLVPYNSKSPASLPRKAEQIDSLLRDENQ